VVFSSGKREKENNKGLKKKRKRDREKEYRTEGRSTRRVEAISIVECNHSFLFLRFNF